MKRIQKWFDLLTCRRQTNNRRELGQELQLYFDNIIALAPGYIYWKGVDCRFLGCNNAQAKMAGLASRDAIIGLSAYDIIVKEQTEFECRKRAEAIERVDKQVILTGESITLEEELLLKDGSCRIFMSQKQPLRNKSGKIIGMLSTSTDMTAERDAQKSRIEQDEEFRFAVEKTVHDIRSPLLSLLMLARHNDVIPEAPRMILKEATNNISDIAGSFLEKWCGDYDDSKRQTALARPFPISLAIRQTLSSKRYQYKDTQLQFIEQIDVDNIFVAINANISDFKRLLSNLVNNAIDAYDDKQGEVRVSLTINEQRATIHIQDWGKGICPVTLEKIRKKHRVTEGEKNGYGIGLAQVNQALLDMQGKIYFDSSIEEGTLVTLELPITSPPSWLATGLSINENATVVVLDDDESIHLVWDERFKGINVELVHFTVGREAMYYINRNITKRDLFLLADFELLNQDITGLDVVKQTNLSNAIIVTGHMIKTEVIEGIIEAGIHLLPKQLVPETPIQVNRLCSDDKSKKLDAIFIDDSTAFTESLHVRFLNHDIATYNDPFVLLDEITQYSKDTPIFTDNGLASALTGIDLAKKLYALGYEKLYLLSGSHVKADELPSYLATIGKMNIDRIEAILGC